MAIFLRVGAWYRATNKALPSDIEITGIIDDPDVQYPTADEISDGGATPNIDLVLAVVPATLTEGRAVNINGFSMAITDSTTGKGMTVNDSGAEVAGQLVITEYLTINGDVEVNGEAGVTGTASATDILTITNGIITAITPA